MKTFLLSSLLLICLVGYISPAFGVNSENSPPKKHVKTEIKKADNEEKKMDGLSLVAYISAMTGIASFFLVPVAGIFLLPAAFTMGLIALIRGKKYGRKKGRGLALTATILGGAFVVLIGVELLLVLLFWGF